MHPLNSQLVEAAAKSGQVDEVVIKERPDSIRVLTLNIQLLPKCVTGETYPCKYWDERMADMFLSGNMDQYDILAVQECFTGLPGTCQEIFKMYAQKAGFLYRS